MTDTLEMKLTETQAERVIAVLKSRVNIRELVEVAAIDINDLKGMRDHLSTVITEIENAGLIAECNMAIDQLKKIGVPVPKELYSKLRSLQGGNVGDKPSTKKGKVTRKVKRGVYIVEGYEPVKGCPSRRASKELQALIDVTGLSRQELNEKYFTPDSEE
ncbi:TPA: hypothetical protein N5Y90_002444 [Vibrio cholerae]|nr:hypothetical protein [Vibrio cholerae]EJB5295494.1 hypothetical protein [Vibrio cholerae]EJL6887711.1 hypothetical protein [Vibrio cholerae]ELJ8610527.1 hypothetical protein [Vibrio cholerae]ELJ8706322.1 hypothetical protein [Vibrio cholerae]